MSLTVPLLSVLLVCVSLHIHWITGLEPTVKFLNNIASLKITKCLDICDQTASINTYYPRFPINPKGSSQTIMKLISGTVQIPHCVASSP